MNKSTAPICPRCGEPMVWDLQQYYCPCKLRDSLARGGIRMGTPYRTYTVANRGPRSETYTGRKTFVLPGSDGYTDDNR